MVVCRSVGDQSEWVFWVTRVVRLIGQLSAPLVEIEVALGTVVEWVFDGSCAAIAYFLRLHVVSLVVGEE